MIPKAEADEFKARFREIVSDPLNTLIERVECAGIVEQEHVRLHNGIRVPISEPYSYYGEFSDILEINRGVHEPLEEFAFQEVLRQLPQSPGMIELGAYWGHYSMWLKVARPNSSVILIEPDAQNIEAGKYNFSINNLEGKFINQFVGKNCFSVDKYLKNNRIDTLDILHADIQGHEVEMLDDCRESLANNLIDYLFISTHSETLHEQCIEKILKHDYSVQTQANFDTQTTSYDGFLLACRPGLKTVLSEIQVMGRNEIAVASPAEQIAYLNQILSRLSAL